MDDLKNEMPGRSKDLYYDLDVAAAEFRIVTIEPGEWGEYIKCTLQTTSLNNVPVYEPLSYVWGTAHRTAEIVLDGQPFPVTANLEAALRHLRLSRPRTMWVDVLCVNQSNIEERGSQVALMRRVYQHGSLTVIWLGEETEDTKPAFELIEKYFSLVDNVLMQNEDTLEKIVTLVNNDPSGEDAIGYLDDGFGQHPWWTRAWVTQEAAVSRELILKCGEHEIPWSKYAAFTSNLLMAANTHQVSGNLGQGLGYVADLTRLREAVSSGQPLPISHLVVWYRWRRATDPRDMVFSLLGLSTDCQDSALLYADYSPSITLVDVSRTLVEHSIEKQNLDILCMNRGTPTPNWPSWIPDWTVYAEGKATEDNAMELSLMDSFIASFASVSSALDGPAGQVEGKVRVEGEAQLHLSDYAASGSMVPECSILRKPPTLTAAGVCVDTIDKLSDICRLHEEEWYFGRIDSFESLILSHFKNTKSVGTNKDAASVTTIAKKRYEIRKNHQHDAPWESPQKSLSISALWERFRLGIMRLRNPVQGVAYVGGGMVAEAFLRTLMADRLFEGGRGNSDLFWLKEEEDDPGRSGVRLLDTVQGAIEMAISHRRMMVSKTGYVGLVPPGAREGDLVCVLFGCSVPTVLRKVGDHHVFVGESYVHGIMDGEVIEKLNRGVLSKEAFVLR